NGSGTVTLAGKTNDYAGGTQVNSGTLLVTGSLTASTINVAASGTVGGTGFVQGLNSIRGKLAPGVNGIGTLAATSLAFSTGGGSYAVDIGSSSADQTVVTTGNVTIPTTNPVQLQLTLLGQLTPGASYRIIDKQSAGAVTGNFSGLPEGASFTVN